MSFPVNELEISVENGRGTRNYLSPMRAALKVGDFDRKPWDLLGSVAWKDQIFKVPFARNHRTFPSTEIISIGFMWISLFWFLF